MTSTVPVSFPVAEAGRRLLALLLRRKLRIGVFVLVVGGLTAGLSAFMQPWYTAEARLLPPTESADIVSNLSGLIEQSALNRIGLFTTATASDVIVEILKSRRVREALIREFDLVHQYKLKTMDATLKELDAHISVKTTSSGVVAIRTEGPSKQEAADMANFLVAELDRFNREVLNTRGKRMRQFLEERLSDAQANMQEADSAVTAYEKRAGVLVSTDESAVRGMSDIVARKIGLQVRRAYVASFSSAQSPEVRAIDAELDAFDRELGELPQVKNEGQRLVLDATIQRKVFSLLSAQYEQARVEEMRDIPTVTVLDDARPPDYKTRPRRTVMVLSSMLVALVGMVGWSAWSNRKLLWGG